MIDVCCAIILQESAILAVQNGPNSSHPFDWEFPGGKIHFNETANQCIIREIQEELKIDVEIIAELASIEFDYGSKQIHLIPFVCKITSGEITLTEHVSKKWFGINCWKSIDWAGADHELIRKNEAMLQKLLMNDSR